MKKLLFLILSTTFIALSVFAKIPAKVTDAFQARYSRAANVEWKHLLGHYKANFNMGEYQLQAKFDKNGKWLQSQKTLRNNALPIAVKNSLNRSKYRQWEIKSSYEEYLPNEKPRYHITATRDLKRKTLVFNHRGQMING